MSKVKQLRLEQEELTRRMADNLQAEKDWFAANGLPYTHRGLVVAFNFNEFVAQMEENGKLADRYDEVVGRLAEARVNRGRR